jgi:hypothetical protein
MGREFDELGNEMIQQIDALNRDVQLGRAIFGNFLQGVKDGLTLAVIQWMD